MQVVLFVIIVMMLNACALWSGREQQVYRFAEIGQTRKINNWHLLGRLALLDQKNSTTVSIDWRHSSDQDVIELSGPLAQGRVVVLVKAEQVVVDDGDSQQVYQGQADEIISALLGSDMPFHVLKYWVLGVNDPALSVIAQENGFLQEGWLVEFSELQKVNADWLPKKIVAIKNVVKIKLVIDQWDDLS